MLLGRVAGGGAGSWRWGICLTFRRWLNFQMHKSGLDLASPFVFRDDRKQTWAMTAEAIVSVMIESGERDSRVAIAIHESITDRIRRGEPMQRILEQLGAWLIESGYFMRDGQTFIRRMNIGKMPGR